MPKIITFYKPLPLFRLGVPLCAYEFQMKEKAIKICVLQKNVLPLRRNKAQMAESVDALVSNTSGATRAGSTPALGTKNG